MSALTNDASCPCAISCSSVWNQAPFWLSVAPVAIPRDVPVVKRSIKAFSTTRCADTHNSEDAEEGKCKGCSKGDKSRSGKEDQELVQGVWMVWDGAKVTNHHGTDGNEQRSFYDRSTSAPASASALLQLCNLSPMIM